MFFFYKIGEQEGGTGPTQREVGTSGNWEVVAKGSRRVNKVQKNVYTFM
jgi:hypothetical protein